MPRGATRIVVRESRLSSSISAILVLFVLSLTCTARLVASPITFVAIQATLGGDRDTLYAAYLATAQSNITLSFSGDVQYPYFGNLTIHELDVGPFESTLVDVAMLYSVTITGFPAFTIQNTSFLAFSPTLSGEGTNDYAEITWSSSTVVQSDLSGNQIAERMLMSDILYP